MTVQDIVVLVRERDDLQRRQDEIAVRIHEIDRRLGGTPATDQCHAILDEIASRRRVSIHRLKTGGRCPQLVEIRNEAAWELRQLAPAPSYQQVARFLGLKNHTSAIHAVKRHQARIDAAKGPA